MSPLLPPAGSPGSSTPELLLVSDPLSCVEAQRGPSPPGGQWRALAHREQLGLSIPVPGDAIRPIRSAYDGRQAEGGELVFHGHAQRWE